MTSRRPGARALAATGFRVAALAALAALASGCVTDQGYLTLASTRNVSLAQQDIEKLDFEQLPRMRDIQGSDTAVTSVLFIPTLAGPQLAKAVDDAIERGHGDLLARARVHTTKYWFLIGIETLTVRGSVIDLPESE